MLSRNYCPKCQNTDIKRIKRGYVRKAILRMSPLYVCTGCKNKFTADTIFDNELIDVSSQYKHRQ